ncbi:pentatricopeptide repeat-containing protein At5g61990, mitochondrial-like [Rosa chinensis]|uniref:pentatricopeptide repeat-containing protein At5g61990, mitochondrial-like n=1 Tax=Rosa chinensis TaxID=74649 RepID=UPI000D0979A4|nr:pentatricopeptide repeat-containing protein At5g61990, mitochondrial-like [Rosa chinensis]XP_024168974.1 pentatricopeptide repeat-containing protein At5g61990, mitochondrial-like [Rosa chinensis]
MAADDAELKSTTLLPDDLERPPEDLQEVLGKMFTEEALTSNTIKMVEGLLRDGFMNMGLEIGAKVQETNEVPRVVTDTAVMEHYINATGDRTKDALRVFKHMLVSGVEPNAYTYAVIIKALAAADLKKNPNFIVYAKNYFVEMLDRGMQPNEETYEAVLEGIGHTENKAEAEEVRREFVENVKAKGFVLVLQKEAEERANPPSLKSEMDVLKEHVMKVFEDATRDCEDENARARFREIGEDYESLSKCAFDLFNALVRKGLNEEAKELFKPLLDTAILPDEAVFIIVILFSRTKSDALKVYEHMLAYGITPSSCTYNLLIATLSLDPNFIGHAKKYYLEMLDKGMKPCLRTSLALFNGIACLESLENGEEFLEQVKPKGVLPDVGEGHFTELMKALKLYDDLQKRTSDKDIQEVICRVTLDGFKNQSSKMFYAMVEDGNVGEAMDLFQSTVESRINPMVIVHTAVIEAYIKCNNNKGALQTYLDMLAAGLAPNSYMYSVLIKGLSVDANYFKDAKKYLVEMLDKGMHPNVATYTAVLEGFARQEDKKAEEEGKEFLEVMMAKGFVPDTEAVREVLKGRPTPVISRVMSIILSKLE